MYTHVFAGFITKTLNYLRMSNVDNTQNIISFCTGYSGLEIGIKRAGVDVRTVVNVEIEAFCCANLVAKTEEGRMDNAPIWTDLKTFPAREFRGKICGLIGGYPCQPFSSAGKRQGEKDPRHLWPYLLKHVRAIRPVWCFWENVAGHTTMGLWRVLSDLEEEGYKCTFGIFSAEEVGAPHQRKRVFILARLGNSASLRPHRGSENCEGEQSEVLGERLESDEVGNTKHDGSSTTQDGRSTCEEQEEGRMQELEGGCKQSQDEWPARPGEEQYEWEEPRVVADSTSRRSRKSGDEHQERERCESNRGSSEGCDTDTKIESKLGGESHAGQRHDRVDAIANRVDRLRLLGNGVCVPTAELAWKTLWKEMNATCHTK